jgi:hypothetical protein
MDSLQFNLDKRIWTDQDFETMGWHDATVHAYVCQPQSHKILFDIDYILKWVDPVPPGTHFTFWVVPATLVFEDVFEVDIQIQSLQGELTIQEIKRSNPKLSPNGKMVVWHYFLDGNEGAISFQATGFKQYFRKPPLLTNSQELTFDERGGISVDIIES